MAAAAATSQHQKILAAFRSALPDTNDLTEAQVKILLKALGVELTEERLRSMVTAASNGSGKVTYEQFISWMFGCQEEAKREATPPSKPKPLQTQKSQHIIEATVMTQLAKLVELHPYAEPGGAASRHPAQPFVENCRNALRMGKFEQAQEELRRGRSVIDTVRGLGGHGAGPGSKLGRHVGDDAMALCLLTEVIITEQPQHLGAVQHVKYSNLIFYVCQPGGADLVDAVRFGMDYVYAAVSFGEHSLDSAKRVARGVSPVPSGSMLRQLMRPHRHWLSRDRRGLSPTSDMEGCFENGPDQFFPGRFHRKGFEASPYYRQVELNGALDLEALRKLDLNAWDLRGETLLFKAARLSTSAAAVAQLLLASADPGCRDLSGRLAASPCGTDLLRLAREELQPGEALAALAQVPEPWRRHLCGRLGLVTAPELWRPSDGHAGARCAASAAVLFANPTAQAAAALGPAAVEALRRLRDHAARPVEERRQQLRKLLREWHPDKHLTRSLELQEQANQIFCFIQKLRDVFLGPDGDG
ncbi:unnamed protein product [Effrenium voratum]|nr:unnamed protein product [Effrenium voratum]